MDVSVRTGELSDLIFLRLMPYEAAYWRAGERPSLSEGLSQPDIAKLLRDWGRKGDLAVIAEHEDELVGAAWFRFWTDGDHSYGYVSEGIPELALAVSPAFRGRGIGRELMQRMMYEAALRRIEQVSLSVESDNPALALYESLGFEAVGVLDNSLTMVAETSNAHVRSN